MVCALGVAAPASSKQCVAGKGLKASSNALGVRRRAGRSPVLAVKRDAADPKSRVVITGQGLASVFGNDVDTFYDCLLEGKSGVDTITRFDITEFPTKFAGQIKSFDVEGLVDKKNARRYDDALSYAMVASKKALRQAGLEKEACPEGYEKLDKTRVGVLVGSGMGGLTVFQDGVKALVEKGHKKITPFFIPYAITNMGSALVGIDQGFMGPNYSISTACATANYAFVNAANHIRNGDADVMVAGGSEASIVPVGLGGFVACRALSTRNFEPWRASRPWDAGRDGFVMGEGAGVLVLESLEHAQARGATILAEYLGGAFTCDAHHMTDPHPEGLGVSTCIRLALADAGVDRDEVNYINAHATSTLVGDKAEIKAVRGVFGDMRGTKMNATKSMIGHCLGAAGGLEAIATIQAIRTGWVHPTINHDDPIPEVEGIDIVPNVKARHDVRVGISNSFGFGGHNSAVAFGPYKEA
uniref:3-oxoacyl-[acyl-carrier-protein] synthase I, chloroplastic n=2 Tax=Auxenochlorella protothecoides TaxID=3075 RepID=A0A1D1ZN72_AUXPR